MLLKSGEAAAIGCKALNYIAAKKDASGTWGTTQSTIMVLRALLLSAAKGSADAYGTVEIALRSKPAERLALKQDNNDLLHEFVLRGGFQRLQPRCGPLPGQWQPGVSGGRPVVRALEANASGEPLSIDVS